MVWTFDGRRMRFLQAIVAALLLAAPAAAVQSYTLGPSISTTTGRATQAIAGTFYVAAGSTTISTPTITLSGASGNITAVGSVTASGYFGDGSHLNGILINTVSSSFTVKGIIGSTGSVIADSNKVYASTFGAGSISIPYGIVASTGAFGTNLVIATGAHILIGGLTPSTTIGLDVVGLVRTSSGIVTAGGNARGTDANDLQITRNNVYEVASGQNSTIGGGGRNNAAALYSTISGGSSSTITGAGDYSTIGGGSGNSIGSTYSTIGGGKTNTIGLNTSNAVIGGGISNTLDDASDPTYPSTISGGRQNDVSNSSFIGGGHNNSATNTSSIVGGASNACTNQFGAVGGGQNNACTGSNCVIAGGASNVASAQYSVVPGGVSNSASGVQSMAAGNRAKATAQGSYVWADSQAADLIGNTTDQYLIRSQGGFYVDSSSASFGSGGNRSTFTAAGYWEPISKTRAQIDLLVPTKVGQVIFCSDCTVKNMCVSTGTLVAQWMRSDLSTAGCGTGN